MADCNRLIPPPLKRSPARAPHIPTLYVQRKRGAAPPGQPVQPQRSVPPLRLAPSKSINHVCRPTLTVQGADGRGNPPCRARGDRLAIARSPAHDASLQSARGHARVDCHASVGKRTDGDRSHSARPGGAQSAASGRRFRPDWRFGEGSREVRAVSCVEPESCRGPLQPRHRPPQLDKLGRRNRFLPASFGYRLPVRSGAASFGRCHDRARQGERLRLGRCHQRAYHKAFELGLDEAEAHFNLAYLELQKGNQQGAITEDNEVLRIDPRYPGARLSLAVSLYETGEYVRAQEILGGLGATEPLLASIRHYPGLALLKLGEAEAAVPELQAAIRLRPDNPESQFALGRALRGIGRHQEAVEAMRAARRAPQVGRNGLYEGEILREPSAATHGSRGLGCSRRQTERSSWSERQRSNRLEPGDAADQKGQLRRRRSGIARTYPQEA